MSETAAAADQASTSHQQTSQASEKSPPTEGSPQAPSSSERGERERDQPGEAKPSEPRGPQAATPRDATSAEHDDEPDIEGEVPDDFLTSNPTLRHFARRTGGHYRIDDLKNDGPTAFGDQATVIGNLYVGPEDRKRRRLFADPVLDLATKRQTFVTPPLFEHLRDRLRQCRVVGLAGAPGTGRRTTACLALEDHLGSNQVMEILLPAGSSASLIREHDELLLAGHGYVVQLPGRPDRGLVRSLEAIFEQRDSVAVLIRDADEPDTVRHRAEVFHRPPASPRDVFRKHLLFHLTKKCVGECGNCDRSCAETYLAELMTPATCRAIELLAQPRECADRAEVVARETPREPSAVAALLPSEGRHRRQQARRILLLPDETEKAYQTRFTQHRRALRLAYAAFAGHSMASVLEGAGLLLDKLDRLFTEPVIGRPALVNDMPELLGKDIAASWHDEDDANPSSRAAVRVARLAPGLVTAILDVAWNDFDNTRPALMDWIDGLATHPGKDFRDCAAVAAAVFASHDFEQVYAALIRRWARDRRPRLRNVAAATMVTAANLSGAAELNIRASQHVGAEVSRRLDELSHSTSAFERDTAAIVWAMGYVPRHPAQTIRALTAVAAQTGAYLTSTVADAVGKLSANLGDPLTVIMMRCWLESEELGLNASAVRSFLSWLESVSRTEDREHLVALLTAEPGVIDDLAALWAAVLLDPACSVLAWRYLAHWMRSGAADTRLARPVRALAQRLVADPALRSRFDHWLSRARAGSGVAA
ncbi:hypothetical protein [Micromonospora chersina]|uniref:hypothetical protein n=1 Tax=Micromonospora chersina TaxID=47854 RepID=UPI003711706C